METLLANLSTLGSNPFAWGVAAIVTLKAIHSLVILRVCPLQRGEANISDDQAQDAASARFRPPLSYLALMLLGIALAVGGLYMLADNKLGALALGAMVVGIFIIMTEPSRLTVISAQTSVVAAHLRGGDSLRAAQEQLRGAYVSRFGFETAIAASVIVALYLI